jgi:pyruvate dehydrogenase E1 component alpha subunit
VAQMREEHDPIDRLRAALMDWGTADENALKAVDKDVKDIVTAAAEFAQQSPEPEAAELFTDVLVEA